MTLAFDTIHHPDRIHYQLGRETTHPQHHEKCITKTNCKMMNLPDEESRFQFCEGFFVN